MKAHAEVVVMSLSWTGNDVYAGRSPQTFSSYQLPVFLHMGEQMDFLEQ